MNSTTDEYVKSTESSVPIWTNQQFVICIISVSVGTLLVFVTFILPAMIIIRRIRRDKHRADLRELRQVKRLNFQLRKDEDMENDTLPCRSRASIKRVNSHSTFGAQGNLTDDKLTVLPVLHDTLATSQLQPTSEIKRTLYDEQLSSSNPTMNWEMEANYICPSVVHHSSNNNYVHLTECVLQSNPTTSLVQNPQTTRLSNNDQTQHDGIMTTAQKQQQPVVHNAGSTKQNFTSFNNTDLNGSKVIRLVRAKQATKRKSSLDTLIEVVQKELLRVNGQSNSTSPSSSPPHYSQTRSTATSASSSSTSSKQAQHRAMPSPVLPSSHPNSLTSQSAHSYKTARKRVNQTKRMPSNRHRNGIDLMDDDDINNSNNTNHHEQQQPASNESTDRIHRSAENIDEIVRDTVDKLVAITLLNNAPFIVNMITGTPGNGVAATAANNESKPLTNAANVNATSTTKPLPVTSSSSDYYRNDLALLSSTASELRNSMQQSSPHKQQVILQPTASPNQVTSPADSSKPSTLFVAPRILNFQTVVPKPTTNIQIGSTKIILVSPATNSPYQQQCLVNNSPVKLVKLTPTLPKNVQIVIPSRASHESLPTTIRPLSTLNACSIDQIPQAAQEVTITTSTNSNKPRRRSSSTTPTDKPVGKILRPIAKVLPVYSSNNTTNSASMVTAHPTHDDVPKPMTVNIQQRPTSTHGPMIYRMTSVNPNVPVFRVRAATAPTSTAVHADAKPLSVATTTGMCYESKQTHNTTTTGGAVSVLACFKTTKKRTKERAIMPRPSTTESLDISHDPHQLTLNSTLSSTPLTATTNVPLIISNHTSGDDLANSNPPLFPSPDYSLPSTNTRLIQQHTLPTVLSDKKSSTVHLLSLHQASDDSIASSSNDLTHSSMYGNRLNNHSTSIQSLMSPVQSSHSRPLMEDKSIQCIDHLANSTEQSNKSNTSKKRNGHSTYEDSSPLDDSWTVLADTLLRNVLSQYGFRFLDVHCQQNLSTKFDTIQANLVSGMISSKDEFYRSVLDIKASLFTDDLSKISADNLEKLFHYFELEYPKLGDGDSLLRTNDRKRTRRQ